MRGSLLLIGTIYLSLGLGSAQACSVRFECTFGGRGGASEPCVFALMWDGTGPTTIARFFATIPNEEAIPVQTDIPPNAEYCSDTISGHGTAWGNWSYKCVKPIWPDGKCSGVRVLTLD